MGAWGTNVFEDDTALDFLEEELLPALDPHRVMKAAFESAVAADYLEYDAAQAVLVCAAVMRALVCGLALQNGEPEDWTTWRAANAQLSLSDLSALASQACRRVASEGSELNELWSENEELYPQWKSGIESLAAAVGG